MLNKEQSVQECDARDDATCNSARLPKKTSGQVINIILLINALWLLYKLYADVQTHFV